VFSCSFPNITSLIYDPHIPGSLINIPLPLFHQVELITSLIQSLLKCGFLSLIHFPSGDWSRKSSSDYGT